MKNFIYILIAGMLLVSCSKEDSEVNYLTSIERAKEGIIGTWERVEQDYTETLTFTSDTCYWMESNSNGVFNDKGTWYISTNKDKSTYYLFAYVLVNSYTINELTNKKLILGTIKDHNDNTFLHIYNKLN